MHTLGEMSPNKKESVFMSRIFYLMGKSASGKDTIYKKVKEALPELQTIVIYTTRPIREKETDGVEYYFVDENRLRELQKEGKVIELREYDTVHGIWHYFTVDDGQFESDCNYIAIGTLESYRAMREYLGEERLVPIYIEVDDGVRLERALKRERKQAEPKYKELCRRFLADSEDFSEENLAMAGIGYRYKNTEEIDACVEEIVLGIKEKL